MRNILLIFSAFILFACKDKNKDNDISSSDYELSPDGLTLVRWKNEASTNINMQGDVILSKVKIIGKGAFSGVKNLGNITLPNDLTSIGESAFGGSKINNIVIPKGVQIIGESAFAGSSLISIQFSEGLVTISDRAFQNCNIPVLNFPDSLQSIGRWSFFENTVIVSVTIPKNVQRVDNQAFLRCDKLTSATFKGMTPPKITSYTFDNGIDTGRKITHIYVPKDKVQEYKSAEGFSFFKDQISAEE